MCRFGTDHAHVLAARLDGVDPESCRSAAKSIQESRRHVNADDAASWAGLLCRGDRGSAAATGQINDVRSNRNVEAGDGVTTQARSERQRGIVEMEGRVLILIAASGSHGHRDRGELVGGHLLDMVGAYRLPRRRSDRTSGLPQARHQRPRCVMKRPTSRREGVVHRTSSRSAQARRVSDWPSLANRAPCESSRSLDGACGLPVHCGTPVGVA